MAAHIEFNTIEDINTEKGKCYISAVIELSEIASLLDKKKYFELKNNNDKESINAFKENIIKYKIVPNVLDSKIDSTIIEIEYDNKLDKLWIINKCYVAGEFPIYSEDFKEFPFDILWGYIQVQIQPTSNIEYSLFHYDMKEVTDDSQTYPIEIYESKIRYIKNIYVYMFIEKKWLL